MTQIEYAESHKPVGDLDVVYIVRKTGVKLVRHFTSPYLAKKFVNKVKRGKACVLVSYPAFD